MKCFTPPKMGVEGIAITAMGPRICTARKAPGARSTSAPGRSHEARGATTTPVPAAPAHSLVSSGRASSSRRRRPSSTRPPTDWDLKLLRATFPFVSTGLTVPVTTLGLAALGGMVLLARRRRAAPEERGEEQDDTRLWTG